MFKNGILQNTLYVINYNESPSSLLNSAKKRKNKQKYKLKT